MGRERGVAPDLGEKHRRKDYHRGPQRPPQKGRIPPFRTSQAAPGAEKKSSQRGKQDVETEKPQRELKDLEGFGEDEDNRQKIYESSLP